MDLEKYRALFLEEATEHLAEMSTALLVLEKSPRDTEAIGVVFRMAHSIKGMATMLSRSSSPRNNSGIPATPSTSPAAR